MNGQPYGPIYNYNPSGSPSRLPAVFDRHVFIVEWQRNLLFVAKADSAGSIGGLRAFRNVSGARDSVVNGPIDIKVGPDGALYLLNWVGNTYNNNAGNGTLTRLEYTGVHVGLSPRAFARTWGGADNLSVFEPGSRFRIPAGSSVVEFYAISGRKLWSYRRDDASQAEFIPLPATVQGVVKVRVSPH